MEYSLFSSSKLPALISSNSTVRMWTRSFQYDKYQKPNTVSHQITKLWLLLTLILSVQKYYLYKFTVQKIKEKQSIGDTRGNPSSQSKLILLWQNSRILKIVMCLGIAKMYMAEYCTATKLCFLKMLNVLRASILRNSSFFYCSENTAF